jgi:uroporphyrinogen decarboxylase
MSGGYKMNFSNTSIKKTEKMKSRERVTRTINHQPVDRMPIDLGFHYSTGISAFAYWNLREYLGLSTDRIDIIDMSQFLARVDEDILTRFHCDAMLLNPGWTKPELWNPRGKYKFYIPEAAKPELQNGGSWILGQDKAKTRMPEGGFFFDGVCPVLEDETEDEMIGRYAREAERIYKDTDYYTMFIGYHAYFKCDDVDWQCRMITDPDEILEENRRIHEEQIKSVKKVIESMGNHIQAIAINSDLGSQIGPLCRPSLYDDLCAPFVKKFCDFVHQNSDLKIFLHSCGAMRRFIPTLIECGVDIFNPVQITAKEMDPQQLKKEFGGKATFWGWGCNTQQILNSGTPGDVELNVRDLVRIFKPSGGFVFNQVHNIMGDVNPENIVAMLDTAYEESFYP